MDDLISREAALTDTLQGGGRMTRREAADILLRCLDVIDYEDYAELIPGEHKAMELAVSALMGEDEDESDT